MYNAILDMDQALLINLYFNLYPTLLLYGGPSVPIIPVNKMFDQISPEKWEKLLLKFSKLISTIVNNRKIDDSLNTRTDIVAFNAAYMFQSCISMAEKDEMVLVVRTLLGTLETAPLHGGSKKGDEFDLYREFQMIGGGGNGSPNGKKASDVGNFNEPGEHGAGAGAPAPEELVPAAAPGAVVPAAEAGAQLARRIFQGNSGMSVQHSLSVGVNAQNAPYVIAACNAAAEVTINGVRQQALTKLALDLSEVGDYSTSKLNQAFDTLIGNFDKDIANMNRFRRDLQRNGFNLTNVIANPNLNRKKVITEGRLENLVHAIENILERNPIVSQLQKISANRKKGIDELWSAFTNRIWYTASIAAIGVAGAGAAYLSLPSSGSAPEAQGAPGAPEVQTPIGGVSSPAGQAIQAGAIGSMLAAGSNAILTGAESLVRGVGHVTGRLASAAVSGLGEGTGVTQTVTRTVNSISSASSNITQVLRNYSYAMMAGASAVAVSAGSITGFNKLSEYRTAKSNLNALEKSEKEMISRFKKIFTGLIITNYASYVRSAVQDFRKALNEHRQEFILLIRGRSLDQLLKDYEDRLLGDIQGLSFQRIALIMSPSEAVSFNEELQSLVVSNNEESKKIIKDFKEKIRATEDAIREGGKAAGSGLAFVLATTARSAAGIANTAVSMTTTAIKMGVGAAVGGPAGMAAAASMFSGSQQQAAPAPAPAPAAQQPPAPAANREAQAGLRGGPGQQEENEAAITAMVLRGPDLGVGQLALGIRSGNAAQIPGPGQLPVVAAQLVNPLAPAVQQQQQQAAPPPPSGTLALTNKQGGSRKYKLKTRKLRKRRKNKTRNFH